MTTTKAKSRKSNYLSRPGPEELSVYSSAKNISMEEKASYFPGVKNTDPFTWKLWCTFLIQTRIVKSSNISCQNKQTLPRSPHELNRLSPFQLKWKRGNALLMLGKLLKKWVLLLRLRFYFIVFFHDQTSGYYILQCMGTSLSPPVLGHGFLFEYAFIRIYFVRSLSLFALSFLPCPCLYI